jgi:DNA ligase (NAD+)
VLELSKKYLNTPKVNLTFKDVKPLQELIKYHSDLYYNKEAPVISDVEYDELFKKLEFVEKKFNVNSKQTSLV